MVRLIFLIMITSILASCVGTVENKNAIKTQTAKTSVPVVSFEGITSATAVSDSKIDVFFNAGSGSPADLKYLVYVNDSKTPIEVSGDKITPTLVRPGEFKYTVENLKVNTYYSLSVGLRDLKTGSVTNSNKRVSAQTLMNLTANFNGVLSAKPVVGSLGATRMEVKWIPAKIKGGVLGAYPEDPVAYRIQYLDADLGSASDLINEDNPNIVTFISDATDVSLIKTSTTPKLLKNLKKSINGTTTVTLPSLTPDTTYYVLVRAIHSSYVDYRLLTGYDYEKNINVAEVTTLKDDASVTWNENSVIASTVPDDYTLAKKNLNWDMATGPFKKFRVYIRNLGMTNNLANITLTNPEYSLIDDAINNNTAMPSSSYGLVINSATPYVQLTDLIPYSFYNVVVAVCLSDSCKLESEKIVSPLINFQVLPTIAPFFGLVQIKNPTSSANLNKVSLEFDSPIVNAGFLTDLNVYCLPHSAANPLTESVLLPVGSFSGTGASIPANCRGLRRNTTTPANLSTFTNIEIEANVGYDYFPFASSTVSGFEYCFAVVPVIKNGATVIYEDKANMITKCSFIQKKFPSILDFPGATKVCSEVNSSGLTVEWTKPTSGIYNGFAVVWRKVKTGGGPFLFSDALNPSAANVVVNPVDPFTVDDDKYYRQNINNANAVSFLAKGLEPGSRYQYGVVAYDKQGTDYNFSEINTNINDCSIALPVAKFEEWLEVFAVGPKEDGRNDFGANGYRSNFLVETLNDYGQPMEVLTNTDGTLDTDFISQFGSMDETTFNGAYGYINNDTAKGKRMYSNQGMVRLAWKDITFSGGGSLKDTVTAYDLIRNSVTVTKPNRRYGYHVYRSSDNQQSWTKLTGDSTVQTADNTGLVHPSPYYEWKRANEGYKALGAGANDSTTSQAKFDVSGTHLIDAVVFTDYSVSASLPTDAGKIVEKARVYYYKVIPVINGVEVKLAAAASGSIIPQNIIRVVLPPPNMSLVSRVIANRQTCLELGRNSSKDMSTFYSCQYDGIGSRTLTGPSILNSPDFVFDVGNDFLIDRFELGCNMTRGSLVVGNSENESTDIKNFSGVNGAASKFAGCFFEQKDYDYLHGFTGTPSNVVLAPGLGKSIDPPPVSYSNNRQLRKGDCLSYSTKSIKSGNYQFMTNYPGFYGAAEQTSAKHEDFFTVYNDENSPHASMAGQSEYAAVHFNTAPVMSSNWYPATLEIQAKGGDASNKVRIKRKLRGESACSVNLPTERSSGHVVPRWIPVNSLGNLSWVDGDGLNPATPVDFSIINKTMGQIRNKDLADNYLYDDNQTKLPTTNREPADTDRFNDNTQLGRVVSSNASKMPPLISLDQKSAQELCSSYKIELGFENKGAWTKLNNKATKKRLMRRTEGVIAGAWPKLFREGRAARNTDGNGNQTQIIPETLRPTIAGTLPAGAGKIPPLVDLVRVEQGSEIALTQNATTPTINTPRDLFNGSCNSLERLDFGAITGDYLSPGALYQTNIFRSVSNNVRSYVFTGSSFFDNYAGALGDPELDTNTQVCTSRYGLQDIPGNAQEVSGEKIHCDASAVNSGATIGLFNFGNLLEADPHIEAGGRLYRTDAITAKGFVSDPAYADDVGSCSVVNDGADRSPAAKSRLFTDSSSIFNTLYNFLGVLTNLIDTAFQNLEDLESVEALRSGDGFFLDFGANGIGTQLVQGDELALYNNPNASNTSPFFSPVVGLALKCPDSVCGTVLNPPVSDNKKISTVTLDTSSESLDVDNFPIGNSQFSSDGVLTVEPSHTYFFSNPATPYPEGILNDVVISVTDSTTFSTNSFDTALGAQGGAEFTIERAKWATDYDQPMRFFNFGSINESGSGRYGGGLYGDYIYEEHLRRAGARCAISID